MHANTATVARAVTGDHQVLIVSLSVRGAPPESFTWFVVGPHFSGHGTCRTFTDAVAAANRILTPRLQ